MKKFLSKIMATTLFVVTLMLTFFVTNADAKICFDTSISCTSTGGFEQYDIDVEVACGSSTSGSTYLRVVSMCSDKSSVSSWTTLLNSGNNKIYCWCKVIRPVVTTWYLAYSGANSLDCADNCTTKCMNAMNSTGFWENVFNAGLKI